MYRRFVLWVLILLLATMALGTYVRVTGAGVACPDAFTCFGQWWPADRLSPEMVARYPGFLYDADAARLQMLHRYGAVLLNLGLLGLLLGALTRADRLRALLTGVGLLVICELQMWLGMLAVSSRLMPAIVALHWLLAVLLAMGLLAWYLSLTPAHRVRYHHTRGLYRYAWFAWGLLLLQGVLGVWVGVNYAALVCPDFPTCHGSWWPPMDWEGLAFWRQWAGGLTGWSMPDAEARITIHWIHRVGGAVSFVVLFGLGMAISSNPRVPHLSKIGLLLNFFLLVVITLGMSIILKGPQPGLVLAHSMSALGLMLLVTGVVIYLRQGPPVPAVEAERVEAVPAEVAVPPVEAIPPKPETLFERLKSQLGKTRQGLTGFLAALPLTGRQLDEELLEEIETHLLMADVGIEATQEIIARLTARLSRRQLQDSDEVMRALHDVLLEILAPCSQPLKIDTSHKPFVILVVGVNGVGKTTTIGKLARRLQRQGYSVMLAAGDTFRAAAVEQLKVWGERNRVPVIAQETGADSASVIYDALQAAKARGIDVLIADTAGRLHTRSNLMEELAKIKRIMAKLDPSAPHEVLLVLDATTGQNALVQAEQFNRAVGVTGIALTKLDGTAKGGVIFALAKRFGIPIRFIGIGEGIDDLQDFDARAFVDALFAEQPQKEAPVLH